MKDLSYFIYIIQHSVGVSPKWERDLVEKDEHLKTFKRWMIRKANCRCESSHSLYHNRLNYLKGWLR